MPTVTVPWLVAGGLQDHQPRIVPPSLRGHLSSPLLSAIATPSADADTDANDQHQHQQKLLSGGGSWTLVVPGIRSLDQGLYRFLIQAAELATLEEKLCLVL
jgi:hypothetical protein